MQPIDHAAHHDISVATYETVDLRVLEDRLEKLRRVLYREPLLVERLKLARTALLAPQRSVVQFAMVNRQVLF